MKAKNIIDKKRMRLVLRRIKRGIKLAFIPHDKNGYRPHLIRRYGLVAIVFVVIGLQLGYNSAASSRVLGKESDITINSLFDQTNQARLKNGRIALKLNDKLNQAAYLKAQNMFTKQYWAHVAPDGTQPWKWLGDVGYNYDIAGENLAKGFTSTDAVMTAWMNSPEHRDNIIKSGYKDVGFAVVKGNLLGESTILIVAFYGSTIGDTISGVATGQINAVTTSTASIMTRLIIAFQSIPLAAIIGLLIIILAIIVAIWSQVYRRKLPKKLHQPWYRHHGIYKIIWLVAFAVIIVSLYSGGQI